MCHTQGREGQYSSEKSIHSDSTAREASHGHVNDTLREGGHTVEEELQRGG